MEECPRRSIGRAGRATRPAPEIIWARLPYDLLGKISNRIINEVKGGLALLREADAIVQDRDDAPGQYPARDDLRIGEALLHHRNRHLD
jgi:hypothetical protein